ncbi:MAG TPA: hypothetical protein VHQ20_00500 [Patescibacteria group bacterium]|jgi:hypothetical protein|nr:hypothetical protein [Patescibacteria group bacterium]
MNAIRKLEEYSAQIRTQDHRTNLIEIINILIRWVDTSVELTAPQWDDVVDAITILELKDANKDYCLLDAMQLAAFINGSRNSNARQNIQRLNETTSSISVKETCKLLLKLVNPSARVSDDQWAFVRDLIEGAVVAGSPKITESMQIAMFINCCR